MSYNFLGLVNDVNKRVNEVPLTSSNFSGAQGFYADIKSGVNSAIRSINQEQYYWPFNHETQEENLIPGTVRYFLPYDAKVLDMSSFRLLPDDDIKTTKLSDIPYEEYVDKYLDYEYNTDTNIRRKPTHVFRSRSFEYGVIPTPDKAYTIAYEYYKLPVDLNNWDDVPSIPEQFRYVILEGAMYHAYAFRGEENLAQISQANFREGVSNMRSIYINHEDRILDTRTDRRYPYNAGYTRL